MTSFRYRFSWCVSVCASWFGALKMPAFLHHLPIPGSPRRWWRKDGARQMRVSIASFLHSCESRVVLRHAHVWWWWINARRKISSQKHSFCSSSLRLPTQASHPCLHTSPGSGGGAEDLQPFALACHLDLLWWACRHAAGWALQSASLQLQREPCSPFLLALWHLE